MKQDEYIFFSKFADSFFLALWMAKNGKNVSFYIDDKAHKDVGRNMGLTIVDDFYKQIRGKEPTRTIVVFDQTGFGYLADSLRKQGFNVAYASIIADKLEEDRTFTTQLLSEIMGIPETHTFSTFDEGRGFLKTKKSDDRFVFKPNGEDTPSDWTYVAKNREDMLNQINYYQSNWNLPKISFELQEFIEGIEVDFSGIMNVHGNWIGNAFELYFEDKKFMDGNLGKTVGCADAIQYFTNADEPLYKDMLSKLTEFLAKNKFSGQCAVNMIISKKDHRPYALEISPRFGYDSMQNEIHTLLACGKDPELLIRAVALGEQLPENYFPQGVHPWANYVQGVRGMKGERDERHQILPQKPRIAMSVRVTIPPYPNMDSIKDAKGKIVVIDESIEKNVYWGDIMWSDKDKQYECTGADGVILVASVLGLTVEECIKKMYTNILPNINARSIQYRMDAGKRVANDMATLRSWKIIQ